ncbi:phenylalanine--tRNA ligase subunit alpha [Candidatus Bathyarchaeota archaeon]|nr:phenylalanine--tRNA ligase subunit alpha [Candidatus Bathyarchaeota archaeon]
MKFKLSEDEVRLLKILEKSGGIASVDRIASEMKLTSDKVAALALNISLKGLLSLKTEEDSIITLTDEGLRYAKLGLPERRIADQAKAKRILSISELVNLEDWEKSIGLAWLRKKAWGTVKAGKVEVSGEATKDTDERLIELIASEGRVYMSSLPSELREAVDVLKERRLIKIEKSSTRFISLSRLGEEALRGEIEILEEVSRLTRELIISGRWRNVVFKKYDVALPSYRIPIGRLSFVREVLDYIRQVWVEMGFIEMEGPILETCFWNYDALYVPQDHPARDLQDTFYVKTPKFGRLPNQDLVEKVRNVHESGWSIGSIGWGYHWDLEESRKTLLRTHTTCLSARTLAILRDVELPVKFFAVSKVFRNEKPDRTHLCEFYQTEGIVVDENANMKNLVGYLKEFFKRLGFPDARFRPAYFPYTEPSLEVEVYCPTMDKWVELAGAGIFRPEVVKPLLGREIPVLAWGLGPGRMIMLNYNLKDMRELTMNDIDLLRSAPVWIR